MAIYTAELHSDRETYKTTVIRDDYTTIDAQKWALQWAGQQRPDLTFTDQWDDHTGIFWDSLPLFVQHLNTGGVLRLEQLPS